MHGGTSVQKGHKLGLLEGKLEGRQEEGYSIVRRLITRRFGSVSDQLQQGIQKLSIAQLEELSEALLDFETVTDLTVWLAEHQQ